MDEELEKYSLDSEENIDSSLDLQKLREDALARIQKYSGNVWTDHNVHDTGIAILEQLCFAIADVSYQFSQLTDPFSLQDALDTSPFFNDTGMDQRTLITFGDLTQAVMEHPGIYKVFYINSLSNPCVRGLYDMVVFTESNADQNDVEFHLNELLNSWRPLASSIISYHFPPERELTIELGVEINETENLQRVLEAYEHEIRIFLQGKHQSEDLSEHRIIDIADFSDKVNFELQSAELVARINAVSYTQHIRHVEIKDAELDFVWTINYSRPYRLRLSAESSISIYQSGTKVLSWKASEKKSEVIKYKRPSLTQNISNSITKEQVEFGSLQNDFPEVYGLEKAYSETLEESDSASLQLKGLLSTYDLLLSKFLAQLEQAYRVLNDQSPNLTKTAEAILDKIPGMEYLMRDFNERFNQSGEDKNKRTHAWKKYLKDAKNNLHELVSSTHRVENEYLESQISSYRFLLSLMGYDLNLFDGVRQGMTLENESQILKNLLSFWLENRLYRIHTKQSIPECLNRDASIGYTGQISRTLGIDFNTTKFVRNIEQVIELITDDKGHAIQLEGDFDSLIKWGRNKDAYQKLEEPFTSIIDYRNRILARFEKELTDTEIEKSIEKLNQVNDLSNGFLLIEHFEFAPQIDEPVFGVQLSTKGSILIDIPAKYTLKELYLLIRNLENQFDSGNYQIVVNEVGKKQFQNCIQGNGIFQPILGFFNTKKDAESEHPQLQESLQKPKLDYHFYDTQFFKATSNPDPYSQTITLCFPYWNEHFYGKGRKKQILRLLDQITPSHLLINTLWLGPFEFNNLIQSIQEYQQNNNPATKRKSREHLFELIA